METPKAKTEEQVLDNKIEILIAIGAATASNCIPCFEHLYEKAINSGVTLAEIKRASEVAGQVKKGAHRPKVIEILKLLPKTNCKECDAPTCMVFATLVAEGGKDASDCPALIDENRKKLNAYLEPFQLNI